jgi:hypothetical protein
MQWFLEPGGYSLRKNAIASHGRAGFYYDVSAPNVGSSMCGDNISIEPK